MTEPLSRKPWLPAHLCSSAVVVLTCVFGACDRDTPVIAGKTAFAKTKPVAPRTPARLSEADLAHGTAQLEAMLADRPIMKRFIEPNDALWTFVVRKFAGEAGVGRISWSAAAPVQGYGADHDSPDANGLGGCIRVRNGLSHERLWSAAVFELYNIAGAERFRQLYERALEGKVSRTSWILGNTRVEFEAVRKAAGFYERVWKPWASDRFSPDPYWWYVPLPESFERWLALYDSVETKPTSYWAKYYDETLLPYLRSRGLSDR